MKLSSHKIDNLLKMRTNSKMNHNLKFKKPKICLKLYKFSILKV